MKRTFTLFGFIVLAALVVTGCGGQSAADEEPKVERAKIVVSNAQTHCPIMGNPIDKEVYVDFEGKRVYFCCPPCMDKFKVDPETYIKKMEAQGVSFERVACEEDHDHGEAHDHPEGDHDHGEAHDHPESDHDHDADHDHDTDADDDKGHDHDGGDHDGHDHG